MRAVSRLTGEGDQNVTDVLGHFRGIVGLKANHVRPNDDDTFVDIVAHEHIVRLGQGHCLTLIQQLITGQIETRTASVTTEPEES